MTLWRVLAVAAFVALSTSRAAQSAPSAEQFEFPDTRALVERVDAAAQLVAQKGEAAFAELRAPGSRWRQGDAYVFVLDPQGQMLVHPDPMLEGKNQLGLKDVNGRPIIRGLIDAATGTPGKNAGWYHYQWPVPGGLLPRWKSSYVRVVTAPSSRRFIVGSGVYNDRMERVFVVDLVQRAAALIEEKGKAAFAQFSDPAGPFIVKDAYVFVLDPKGVELVNPAFPNLEGHSLLDHKDTRGKEPVREMLQVAQTRGSGWVDYMWPKPGESVPTQKSAYVQRVRLEGGWALVACGVYLADAPKEARRAPAMTAPQLMALVRDAAALLSKEGEQAFPQFREKGSKWFRDDTYLFVWTLDGTRVFHAADPASEGRNVSDMKDVRGRPIGKAILDAAQSPSGEGWLHYLYPEPGGLFPAWKSTFVKRVAFPSGKQFVVGSGVYDLPLDKALVEDLVDRASALVAARGKDAFPLLRDKTGPFVFMDTYVFVTAPDGTELVNGGQPSLEGKRLLDAKDVNGKFVVRDYLAAAMTQGSAWVSYVWFKPGENTPAPKQAFVRRVQSGKDTFVVGSGLYSK